MCGNAMDDKISPNQWQCTVGCHGSEMRGGNVKCTICACGVDEKEKDVAKKSKSSYVGAKRPVGVAHQLNVVRSINRLT